MAAFVGSGGSSPSALMLLDPSGRRSNLVLPRTPRNFCAPVWLDDHLYYVAEQRGRLALVRVCIRSLQVDELETVDGLVALVASPDRRWLARAVAPRGDGSPYTELVLHDVVSGHVRRLPSFSGLAFTWTPTSDALLVASVDTRRNLLEWSLVTLDGESRPLPAMHPSRELAFYLRFFEQYTQSHPIVDPTGTWAVVGGGLPDDAPSDPPRLWRMPLDGEPMEPLADGVFGVFAPATPSIG